MSRYNGSNGGSNGGDNDYDDTTLKLQKNCALRLEPSDTTAFTHDQYGTSFIINYDAAEVIDGIVLQRDDKPGTWKVFSAGKFFHLNPEDGLVYEDFDEEEGYDGEMSAQDILDHKRVAGFSESAGGTDYFYTPVGVVVEEADDIALNDDLVYDPDDYDDGEEPDGGLTEESASNARSEGLIPVGEASMLLSNNSWVRTFAKKMTTMGDDVVSDNGMDPTPRGEDDDNPKYSDHEWLATDDPDLRSELESRSLELWITEETNTWDDGEETTYDTPNLMDVKTGNFVTIDNGISDNSDTDKAQAKATDGGTKAQSGSDSSTTESPDEPSADGSGLPENVPDKLDDLIDYMARNNDGTTADEIRDFAADEVDDPDEIDWEAAAEEANQRSN